MTKPLKVLVSRSHRAGPIYHVNRLAGQGGSCVAYGTVMTEPEAIAKGLRKCSRCWVQTP